MADLPASASGESIEIELPAVELIWQRYLDVLAPEVSRSPWHTTVYRPLTIVASSPTKYQNKTKPYSYNYLLETCNLATLKLDVRGGLQTRPTFFNLIEFSDSAII